MKTHSIFLRLAIITGLSLAFLCPTARAIGPSGDVFAGYSNVNGISGWKAAAHLKLFPFIGIEGNVSGYGYGRNSSSQTAYLFFAGPRATVSAGRVHLFAHALLGGGHSYGDYGNPTVLLYALGGGLDFPVISRINWRVGGDFLSAPSLSSLGNKAGQFSTGPVLRF